MESSGNLISLPTVKCKNSHAPTDPQKRRVSKICYHFLHCYGRPTEARLGRGFILFGSFFQLYQILVTVIFANGYQPHARNQRLNRWPSLPVIYGLRRFKKYSRFEKNRRLCCYMYIYIYYYMYLFEKVF